MTDGGTVYVTDHIQADVYPAPRAAGAPVGHLPTGTALHVLAHRGDFVRVRTADNSEGWIPARQLQEDPPAQTLLIALAAQQQRTAAELNTTRRQLAALQQTMRNENPTARRWWDAAALLLAALAGFLGGMKWLDWRLRERHGGMRM